jgi:hypothetical protein
MRRGKHSRFTLGVVALIFIVAFCLFIFNKPKVSSLQRVNIVLATSPITVWSWNKDDGSFIVISLPSDAVIDAIHGYGKYSLEALWKLGFIEDATTLNSSLSYALGIPIQWYSGSEGLPSVSDPVSYGREYFSLTHIFGRRRTNIPLSLYISFSRALASARVDKIEFIDFTRKIVTYDEDIPDGSKRKVVDLERVDEVLKGIFEDSQIRKESISVAIYNSTQVPSLGNRAARLLTQSGILVVSVGNEDKEISQCEIEGTTHSLETKTASNISDILGCKRIPVTDQRRTDLTVKIGGRFASLFSPQR